MANFFNCDFGTFKVLSYIVMPDLEISETESVL